METETVVEKVMRDALDQYTKEGPAPLVHIPSDYIIYKTTDYARFIRGLNRRFIPKKVDELAESMEQDGYDPLFPITVNPLMEITDGQHRHAAAERTKKELLYRIDEKATPGLAAIRNSQQDHWKKDDFLYLNVQQALPDYLVLDDFLKRHPWVSIYQAARFCNKHSHTDKFVTTFQQGRFVADNMAYAEEITRRIEFFERFDDRIFFKTKAFIGVMEKLYYDPHYKHEKMVRKLSTSRSARMVRRSNVQEYQDLLESIFNYREPQERHIRFGFGGRKAVRDKGGRFAPIEDSPTPEVE